jgi:hypothetical protein
MSLGDSAFDFCLNLSNVYSYGNAPAVGSGVFNGDSVTTVYYMPGTTGWSSTLATATAVLWNPQIQTNGPNFGVVSNQFGFNITGTSNDPVLLEVCTNLASQVWTPLTNVSLSNGLYYYSEPMQSNAAVRFYRIVLP